MVRRPEGVKQIEDIYRGAIEGLQIDFSRNMGPQIYDALRNMVVRNTLPPGTPIYEAKFADMLGVSRTPLRAALQQMAKEGLVETRPQVGSIIAPVDSEKIASAVFCRSALEVAVVRRLAEMPNFDAKPFRLILAAQEDFSSRDDFISFFEVDEAFHAQLAESAGVPEAWRLILSNKTHVDRARLHLQSTIPGRAAMAYREHLDILQAIEAGQPDLAARHMHKHVTSAQDVV